MQLRLIDRYVFGLSLGTLGSVVGIIMSLMVLEHIPRLIDITRLSEDDLARFRRDTRAFESIFDDLEGIGPARRRAILNHFGSAEAFVDASREELEGVPGLPSKTARAVYAQLHKAGRG